MIFSSIIIVLVGVVAYWHYLQGLFSAFLSAVLAAVSAVLAIAFYEQVLLGLMGGARADFLTAGTIIIIYAVSYTLLRLAFDGFVPGNIRLPVIVDKIGAGVFGVVAGIFATGTIAVAAQTLPLGPSVIDYSRAELRAIEKRVMMRRQMSGPLTSYELPEDGLEDTQSLLLPVDEWVVGFTAFLSDQGSLAGDQPLTYRHPDLLTQLFTQRLGTQPGVRRTAVNVGDEQQVTVPNAFILRTFKQVEGESPEIRKPDENWKPVQIQGVPVVVRAKVTADATGSEEQFVRFSTGAVRLVVGEAGERQNLYPIGTLGSPDAPNIVALQKPTDFLLLPAVEEGSAVDLVFDVPESVLQERAVEGGQALQFTDGVLFEFKRFGWADLSGMQLTSYETSPDLRLLRKPALKRVLEAVQGGTSYEEATSVKR